MSNDSGAKSEPVVPSIDIAYVFAIPSWDPRDVTPFQGFAPGLLDVAPLLGMLPRFPADLAELAMDEPDRLARRRAGSGSWQWSPVNVEMLIRRRKPTAEQPLMVVFSAEPKVARMVSVWRRGLRIRPLHVSFVEGGGAIGPSEFSIERLRQHCRNALRKAGEVKRHLDVSNALALTDAWRPLGMRPSRLRLHSHNVVLPNQMVLESAGEVRASGTGCLKASPEQDYVDAITESAAAVLALHPQTEDRPIYLVEPPRPDIVLLAPATFRGIAPMLRQAASSATAKRAATALERQRGYKLEIPMGKEDLPDIGQILSTRGAELKLQTLAVGLRAASTLAATIRLPPAINRTAGVVGHLSRHMRAYDDATPDVKTARVFKIVQDALLASIPAAHLALIAKSRSGVKIIGDAPLEWLPLDGLPLGIRKDTSRINATPGNIMIEQLRSVPPIHIRAEAFKAYLVVSMFEDGDGIANDVRHSLQVLPGASGTKITGTRAIPRTVDEFVVALNAYDGPILIVDGHGSHPQNPDVGGLVIGGRGVDVWTLRDRVRVPPIVVLSACDTHPFDRSHATVANGFLHCGALAVLATVLPIRARDAAVFLARLMLRAMQFGDAMSGIGRAVPWTNIVGGALRMQLASDIVRGLVRRGLLPTDRADEVQLGANLDINRPRPDWLERLGETCRTIGGFGETRWRTTFDDILAGSDVIRYVNLGNPESILIADERVFRRAIEESQK